jgi:hypothetical protein
MVEAGYVSVEVVYSLIWFDISLPERVAEKEKVH